MGKQNGNGQNITPRHTFPISEMLSGDSLSVLDSVRAKRENNAAAIRRVHSH